MRKSKCPTCGIDRELHDGYCECHPKNPEWAEVVEDIILADERGNVFLNEDDLNNRLALALGMNQQDEGIPVRIKCRAGAILIERIGGKE